MSSIASLTRTYTPEEFLDVEDHHRWELIDGILVERHSCGLSSQVAVEFIAEFVMFARSRAGGTVTGPDGGFRIFGPANLDWVRLPDVAFLRRGKVPGDRHGDRWISIVPGIAVEIVSPGDTAPEVDAKARLWLSVGVATVWVAGPEQESIDVYNAGSEMQVVRAGELLTDDQLPGFSVKASSFFP